MGPWLSGIVANHKGNKMEQERDDGRSKTPLPELNLGRRRLVRSVTAAAPLVLTLRSGAVAAAVSCVGAKVIDSTDSAGKIIQPGSAAAGDTCVAGYQVCPNPGESNKIIPGANMQTAPVTSTGPNLFCGSGGGKITSKPVAILSSIALNSFLAKS